jgi:outer membrane protein TolC
MGPTRTAEEGIANLSGAIELSLSDAIRIGLERNLDLQVVRFDPYIAAEDIGVAWGAYDPLFANEFGYTSSNTPNASLINRQLSIQQRLMDGKTGMTGLVPWWGASYEIGYEAEHNTTNATISALSPQVDSNVFGRVTMPLLKNLIWNQAWTQVKTSNVIFEGSREEFRRQVMDIVQRIENAYWEVIATRNQLKVAQKSVETARALLDQTKTQYEVGVVSKVEVTEAEAGLAQRDFNLIVASNTYRAAQDTLSDLVFGESLLPGSTYRLETTDEPADFTAFEVDPEAATKKAFRNRPELAAAKLEIARQELLLKFARNQTLPQLDAVLSYGRLGQSGSFNQAANNSGFLPNNFNPDTIGQGPSVSNANDQFFGANPLEQFAARGVLTIPLGNQAATSTASKTALELRKTMSRERRLEQDIVLGVRTAIRDLRSAQEGVFAAERAVAAAAEQLRAERIRLDNGESTPFNVLLRESDLVTSESGQIGALRAYRNATTNLDRAQGTILKTHRIRIDEVGALR